MSHLRAVLWVVLAGCASKPAPTPAAPATPGRSSCAYAMVLRGEKVEELRAADVPACEQQLGSELRAEQEARARVFSFLDEERKKAGAALAVAEAALAGYRAEHGLASLSFKDLRAAYAERFARRKPNRAQREQLLALDRHILEEERMLREIDQLVQVASMVGEKQGELRLGLPTLQVLEPCVVCPPARAAPRRRRPGG